MPQEPAINATPKARSNSYEDHKASYAKRWRWWYASISDWMIQNPGGTFGDCAKALNKNPTTISLVAGTDLFRDYHQQRMAEFRRNHDFAIAHKLTAVAELGLDMTLKALESKKDQVPLATLVEITSSSLEKLGYGVTPPAQVNIQNNGAGQTVVIPVSADALNEARNALRLAEERRALEVPQVLPLVTSSEPEVLDLAAEPSEAGTTPSPRGDRDDGP